MSALRGRVRKHPDKHVLYSDTRSGPDDRMSFENQFNWRRTAATRHITDAYTQIAPTNSME